MWLNCMRSLSLVSVLPAVDAVAVMSPCVEKQCLVPTGHCNAKRYRQPKSGTAVLYPGKINMRKKLKLA